MITIFPFQLLILNFGSFAWVSHFGFVFASSLSHQKQYLIRDMDVILHGNSKHHCSPNLTFFILCVWRGGVGYKGISRIEYANFKFYWLCTGRYIDTLIVAPVFFFSQSLLLIALFLCVLNCIFQFLINPWSHDSFVTFFHLSYVTGKKVATKKEELLELVEHFNVSYLFL